MEISLRRRILWFALAIGLIVAMAWAFRPPPVPVDVAEVRRGAFELAVEEDGISRVRDRYVVSAPLTGRLERLRYKAGDAVTRGQVLARLLPVVPPLLDERTERELLARLAAAQAGVQRVEAEVGRAAAAAEQALAEARRAEDLARRGYVSANERERAAASAAVAGKELEAARFGRQVAAHELATVRAALLRVRGAGGQDPGAMWEVRSPVDGRVLKVVQESEAVVASGAALLEIGNPGELEVVADLLTTDAVQVQPGAVVRIEGWGGLQALQGRVRRVEPAAFTKVSALGVEEQRVNVVIDIESPLPQRAALGDGYRVDVRVVVLQVDDAVLVPVGALFRDGAGWAVFVATEGRAERRAVEIRSRNGRDAVVDKGLEPGERVILYPGNAVESGTRVEVRAAPE